MNMDITGVLITLSLSILMLISHYKNGASDVNVHYSCPIICCEISDIRLKKILSDYIVYFKKIF